MACWADVVNLKAFKEKHSLFSFYDLDSENTVSSFTSVQYATVTGEFLCLLCKLAVSL